MNNGIGLTSRRSTLKSRSHSEGLYNDFDERQNLLELSDGGFDNEERNQNDAWNNNYRTWKTKDEEILIPMLGRPPSKPPIDQCVETEIRPEETLASISLKYNVPVAELKRVNRFINEKDFFARKTIRVPVKTASLLTEILPASGQRSPLENRTLSDVDDFGFNNSPKADSSTPSTTPEVDRAQRLLKQIDNNLEVIAKKQERTDQDRLENTNSTHIRSSTLKEDSSVFDLLNTNKKWIGFYLVVFLLAGLCIYLLEHYERQILTHSSRNVFSIS